MVAQEGYTLHYFAEKGLAEPIRLMLIYARVEWKEIIHDPAEKSSGVARELLTWMNPVLELPNGELLADAIGIGQYLGDELGLAPKDAFLRARAMDAAECFMSNINGAFEYLRNIPGELPQYWQEERQDRFERFLWSMILPRIHHLDAWLEEGRNKAYIPGFIFGANPCWADFYLYNAIRAIQTIPGAWVKGQFYVWLEQFLLKVESLPKVGEYIAQRKDVAFFSIDPSALVIQPPFRVVEAERVIRMLPLPDEQWSSDEDQRVVIPKWDYVEKEKRQKAQRRQRVQIRKEWEAAEAAARAK
uniref:GST N-terminal domain-containing protein n=1 Tax=Plectus sambesii TaxID=2011161 RepID=A0A914VRJ6_9BILA